MLLSSSEWRALIERFPLKVFVGGLPPDIDEGKMMTCDTKEKKPKI